MRTNRDFRFLKYIANGIGIIWNDKSFSASLVRRITKLMSYLSLNSHLIFSTNFVVKFLQVLACLLKNKLLLSFSGSRMMGVSMSFILYVLRDRHIEIWIIFHQTVFGFEVDWKRINDHYFYLNFYLPNSIGEKYVREWVQILPFSSLVSMSVVRLFFNNCKKDTPRSV